jgi:hypothetical protein
MIGDKATARTIALALCCIFCCNTPGVVAATPRGCAFGTKVFSPYMTVGMVRRGKATFFVSAVSYAAIRKAEPPHALVGLYAIDDHAGVRVKQAPGVWGDPLRAMTGRASVSDIFLPVFKTAPLPDSLILAPCQEVDAG